MYNRNFFGEIASLTVNYTHTFVGRNKEAIGTQELTKPELKKTVHKNFLKSVK